MTASVSSARGMKAIAVVEALKGATVLLAGFGLLGLMHRDVAHIAASLVTHLHLDPDGRYAGLFIDAAAKLTDTRLWGLAAIAAGYSALRVIEGYGLWKQRRWAAWLGAASGAIYVPVEVYELWSHPSPIKAATLTVNVAVVLYLLWSLRRQPMPMATQRQVR